MKSLTLLLTGLILTGFVSLSFAADKVEKGKKVQFNYVLKVDGKVVEESKQPLTFTVGGNMIIPGLENKMMGMKVGDKKEIVVAPKDAYGEIDPKMVREVAKTQFPKDFAGKPGMMIELKAKGQTNGVVGIIKEIKDAVILVDFNHPLAGKTLNFNVEVVKVD
ncbi:MAG: peptidylprolyl isomerase [Candidatus Omnitrophica bacterium]|nr:peptidylprolyl isomerase [Candidatus Omnitrophota bacterium]